MARTPAQDRAQAEYDAIAAHGHRAGNDGSRITSNNRGPVRAWLTACGVSSEVARSAPLDTLREAWADTTDQPLALLRALSGAKTTTTTTKEPAPMPSQDLPWVQTIAHRGERTAPPVTIDHEPAPRPTPGRMAGTAATRLAEALAEAMAAQPATLDADAVRAIVVDEVAKAGPSLTPEDVARMVAGAVASAVASLSVPSVLQIVNPDRPTVTLPAARHHLTEACVQIVSQNVPLCLVGPAGAGKTTLCEMVATALSLPFYMDGAPSGSHVYLGFVDAHGTYHRTPFREAFENGGVYLADELDGATDPAAPLTLNSALANGVMAFPDSPTPVKRHPDFRMIAACNTFGTGADRVYVGRVQLDGATLDRFAFLDMPYDLDLERALSTDADWLAFVHKARAAVASLSLRHIVSTRAILNGQKLRAAGIARDVVESVVLWKGLAPADVARVRSAIRG
jgi:cobaltochelatase CobS